MDYPGSIVQDNEIITSKVFQRLLELFIPFQSQRSKAWKTESIIKKGSGTHRNLAWAAWPLLKALLSTFTQPSATIAGAPKCPGIEGT